MKLEQIEFLFWKSDTKLGKMEDFVEFLNFFFSFKFFEGIDLSLLFAFMDEIPDFERFFRTN